MRAITDLVAHIQNSCGFMMIDEASTAYLKVCCSISALMEEVENARLINEMEKVKNKLTEFYNSDNRSVVDIYIKSCELLLAI